MSPLIGVLDPRNDARERREPGVYPPWLTLDRVLENTAIAPPEYSPWPYELVKSLVGNHQERDYLSVTALVGGCMRGTLIERKEEYVGDLDTMYAALRGSMVHRTLENSARENAVAEWRFFTTIDGVEISCSPDLVTHDTLLDWKTTENPPYMYMWVPHKLQLQFNRFIFNHAERWDDPDGVPGRTDIPLDPHNTNIRHLAIVYLGPKGPHVLEHKRTVETKIGPDTVTKVRVPDVWTDGQVLADLRPRMEGWKIAWESYPDWPDGLEDYPGWAGPPEYRCHGAPLCFLPGCLAKRYPNGLRW